MALGSSKKINEEERSLLKDVSVALSDAGWNVRVGGRGDVDDIVFKSAAPDKRLAIIPFNHFRGYKTASSHVESFESFDLLSRRAARKHAEPHFYGGKLIGELQKNLLHSGAMVVFGSDLKTPARFGITALQEGSHGLLGKGMDASVFSLMNSRGIPVFNLCNPEHKEKIYAFLNKNSAVV